MTAIYAYYLAFSSISKAALLADPSNNIENWTNPADVPSPAYAFTEPHRELTKRPTPARETVNADLSTSFDGFFAFQWGFRYWTQGQMAQVLSNFGSANDYSVATTLCTVQTFFDSDYVCFHANLYRPVWGNQYASQDGGYENVILRFAKGIIIS